MKVLITGMAGLIGVNLARHLAGKGIEVVGIDNFTPNYPIEIKKYNIKGLESFPNVKFIEGNINDPRLFGKLEGLGITHIVHLAARAGVRDSTIVPQEYLYTNIIGSLNVLEFARKIHAKKTLLASTSSAYGLNSVPFKESQCIQTPLSIYAASKIGMENLAFALHRLHGTPIILARFFTVYGPGGRPDMAVYKFTDLIMNRKPIEVNGDGSQKRDFTYVTDICEGIYLALKCGSSFDVFNFGHSDARPLKELISLIEKASGKKAKIKYLPKNPEDPEITLADISKAKKMFGYNPKISLEDGIPLFIEWHKKYKNAR